MSLETTKSSLFSINSALFGLIFVADGITFSEKLRFSESLNKLMSNLFLIRLQIFQYNMQIIFI